MQDKTKYLIGMIVVIGILIFISGGIFENKYNIFSILPAGQCTTDSTNKMITNVEQSSIYSGYASSSAWLAIDYSNSGTKGKFGEIGTASGTGRINQCNPSVATLLIENLNSNGDDVYFYMPTTSQKEIEICSPTGMAATKFRENYGSYTDAMTTCGTCTPNCVGKCGGVSDGCGGTCNAVCTCTPNWVCGNWGSCNSGTQTRTCSDSNNCGTTNPYPTSQTCSQSCNTFADTNCDNIVSDSEFNVVISAWISGLKTRSDLNVAGMAWIGQ